MNGIILFFILTLSYFSFNSQQAYAGDHLDINTAQHILILKSKESLYYNQTIHSISNKFEDKFIIDIYNIKQNITLKNISLIITFGTSAALYARHYFPNMTKVFTFINLKQSIDLKLKPNETHVLIELKTSDYLTFSNTILPHKRIGILYQKSITKIPNNPKLDLYTIDISNRRHIISATRDVIKYADVLLALPNKNIFNRHSLKGILLSTYQNKTPLVSYSPSHVKAGAIAAIYASPSDIGQHTIEIMQRAIANPNSKPERYFAKYYSTKINLRVAQSLGITLDVDMINHMKSLK